MNSRELGEALAIYERFHDMSNKSKKSAVLRLRELRFSLNHISRITNLSVAYVQRVLKENPNIVGGVRGWFDKFEPATLDALLLLRVSYEDDGEVNGKLVRNIAQWGTGLHAMAYITDIPVETLREAANGTT